MDVDRSQAAGFARASYKPRVIGLPLGFLTLASVVVERQSPWWCWLLLGLHAFVWPHLAWLRARRSADPTACERQNMLVDHVAGGMWLALIAFNLVPSALMVAMMSMDSMIAGGLRLLWRGAAAHVAGVAVGLLVFGVDWQPASSLTTVVACLPLLLVHPIGVGLITHRTLEKLRRQRAELAQQSRRDGLSGLFNRHYWEERVKTEFNRCQRKAQPAALVLVDLDHFKRVNDERGHEAGDTVIRRFSELLRSTLRDIDVAGRYGGEEFGILLPQTTPEAARVVMDRLRDSLHETPLLDGQRVTASFGVAGISPDLENHEAWMRLADQMLYRAKHRGRDQVSVAGESRPASLESMAGVLNAQVPADPAAVATAATAATAASRGIGWQFQHDPQGLSRGLSGLDDGHSAVALFDPEDRLVLANAHFHTLHDTPADARTFGDIIRHCHATRRGPRIDTHDIEAWLSAADTKRRSRAYRSFRIDLCDGRIYRVNETSFENGWLLYVSAPEQPFATSVAAPFGADS